MKIILESYPNGIVFDRYISKVDNNSPLEDIIVYALQNPKQALAYKDIPARLPEELLNLCAPSNPAGALMYASSKLSIPVLNQCIELQPKFIDYALKDAPQNIALENLIKAGPASIEKYAPYYFQDDKFIKYALKNRHYGILTYISDPSKEILDYLSTSRRMAALTYYADKLDDKQWISCITGLSPTTFEKIMQQPSYKRYPNHIQEKISIECKLAGL